MSILQDFFNGELLPWEQFGTPDDPVYKSFVRKSAELEETILLSLNEKELKVYEEIKHLRTVQNNSELERMFLYAFRMGALFVLDLYRE